MGESLGASMSRRLIIGLNHSATFTALIIFRTNLAEISPSVGKAFGASVTAGSGRILY